MNIDQVREYIEEQMKTVRIEIRDKGRDVVLRVQSTARGVEQGRLINTLGELQGSAAHFDTACARYAFLQQMKMALDALRGDDPDERQTPLTNAQVKALRLAARPFSERNPEAHSRATFEALMKRGLIIGPPWVSTEEGDRALAYIDP